MNQNRQNREIVGKATTTPENSSAKRHKKIMEFSYFAFRHKTTECSPAPDNLPDSVRSGKEAQTTTMIHDE